ncbi:maleylpyruvate isomerase family mycothiol-dependent enzyme [Pseudarthrobacter sp. J1738]|uniref:maleylpyruvate isomerase family mycothiol-dependent enzyme n=1 Tax=Pseudarthrobacter sp. J1738 TaxID=3420446 RepID=UPI003D272511
MTQITSEQLCAAVNESASALRKTVAGMVETDVAQPSQLPEWTRGHVLAHLCGVSAAVARQLEFAARGELIDMYDGGQHGRDNAINKAASQSLEKLAKDLNSALDQALAALNNVEESGWDAPVKYRDSTVREVVFALWRELVIHTSDLGLGGVGAGRGPETWSKLFCEHLFDFLEARVPAEQRFVIQALGMPPRTLGNGPKSTVISGMVTDLAAWLAGRTPSLGTLRADAAADGVDLPQLMPWPSGIPSQMPAVVTAQP